MKGVCALGSILKVEGSSAFHWPQAMPELVCTPWITAAGGCPLGGIGLVAGGLSVGGGGGELEPAVRCCGMGIAVACCCALEGKGILFVRRVALSGPYDGVLSGCRCCC